ncbi:MAG TPA: histidine kinase [Micromonosporaceae bacterium]|nr:histidine kinase [Micromonosporaceae bacterium]
MSQPQRQPARLGRVTLPTRRADADQPSTGPDPGGVPLVTQTFTTNDSMADEAREADTSPAGQSAVDRTLAWVRSSRLVRGIASDVLVLAVAALDVWLVTPEKAETYSIWLSWISVAATLLRRHFPFVAILLVFPGFLAGWAQLAAMIVLGTLAYRYKVSWQTAVGAGLVWCGRFVLWPWEDFLAQTWREHVLAAIYGVIVAGMPVALAFLILARQELSDRIAQLAESRDRESRLQAETIRSTERARLAREMHDMVSHQVTLIAMQAGALQVSARDEEARQSATTIRELSTRTLEELRNLVGVLRSGLAEEDTQPGLDELTTLAKDFDIEVDLDMVASPELVPAPVSRAAYRTVQEALTNVRKHAVGAAATVRVETRQDTLYVEVRNDRPRTRASGLPSGGHGLLGLRERTGLLGGTFEAGPTPEGGFRVEATYPIELRP